ncbi:FBF1 factor, partial [Zosterops hypoxanthus]|nr:FBF1 factor [Zosterops hypoxanthus]
QDRLGLARQREQLQQLRDELSLPGTLLGSLQGTLPGALQGTLPGRDRDTLLSPPAAAPVAPGLLPALGTLLGDSRDSLGSAALYGHLLLLKHRARMDHDFLENEQLFLESLKKGG